MYACEIFTILNKGSLMRIIYKGDEFNVKPSIKKVDLDESKKIDVTGNIIDKNEKTELADYEDSLNGEKLKTVKNKK
jgi:hypothetical protein